ncbi:MAG TPA: GNAT family protein [Jatrophihabitans sp.]|jgi:GNAT superfamily N-acetyltransferase
MTSVRGRVGVSRRSATPADIPFLRALFADAHLELTCLPTDTRFVLVDMQFRAQRRQHAANHPHATHEIVLAEGSDAGRLLVDRSSEPIRLVDVSIALGHRRTGIAASILADLTTEADSAHRSLETTVWSGNTAAVALVEHNGFVAGKNEAGYVTYARAPHPAGAAKSS